MRTQFLQRTVEVLHDKAKFCQIFLLMYHVEQRGIIFVDDDHHLLASLLVGTFYESIQPVVGVQFILITAIEFLKWLQLQVEIMLQAFPVNMLGTAHIEMKHWVLHPILLVIRCRIVNSKINRKAKLTRNLVNLAFDVIKLQFYFILMTLTIHFSILL